MVIVRSKRNSRQQSPPVKNKALGQALIEFSLVLPIFLLLLLGMFNLGNIVIQYGLITTASREASRYGAAIGNVNTDTLRYYDCDGIRSTAIDIMGYAYNETTTITIHYDTGPGGSIKYASCEDLASLSGADEITMGDRIVVTVNSQAHILEALLGAEASAINLKATSSKLIVKDMSLE
jgi:Flp pilus assembly protein TadG